MSLKSLPFFFFFLPLFFSSFSPFRLRRTSFSPSLLSLPFFIFFLSLSLYSFSPFLCLLSLPFFVFFLSLSSSSFSPFHRFLSIPFFPSLRLLSLPFIVFLLSLSLYSFSPFLSLHSRTSFFLPFPSAFFPFLLLSPPPFFLLLLPSFSSLLRELLGYFLKNHRLICIFSEHPYLGSNAKAQLRASWKSAWG